MAKVTVSRSDLLNALRIVVGASDTKAEIPILSQAKVTIESGSVKIEATDMEQYAATSIDCQTGAAYGSVMLPVSDVIKTLPAMDGDTVTIASDGDSSVSIEAASGRAVYSVCQVADFPEIQCPRFENASVIIGQSDAFARSLGYVAHAMSTEKPRYYLNGICLDLGADGGGARHVRMVTTDGHRLSLTTLGEGFTLHLDEKVSRPIIPRHFVNLMKKVLPAKAANAQRVKMTISEKSMRICVKMGRTILASKLIDGPFPEYQRVIPKNNENAAGVATKSFLKAIKPFQPARGESSSVALLHSPDGYLNFDCKISGQDMKMSGRTEAEYVGNVPRIGFQARYLKDAASDFVSSETFVMRFASENDPVTIHDPARPDDVYVLMPARV